MSAAPTALGGPLRQRYDEVVGYLGLLCAVAGGLLLTPLLALPWDPRPHRAWAFWLPGLTLLLWGGWVYRRRRTELGSTLRVADAGVAVVASWVVVCLASAWPVHVLTGLGFTASLFEAVSQWTTTGLTVVEVTTAPPSLFLWRSVMQLAGGAGLAILTMASIVGPAGVGLALAEGRTDQLVPQVKQSVRLVAAIYGGYAVAGTVALRLAGMGWFDALNHSFAAVSTGGSSTRPQSVGAWDSAAVELVCCGLMLLGSINFATAYLVLRRRWRAVARNGELRLLGVLLPTAVLLVACGGLAPLYHPLAKVLRVACFETVSALSTTGFSTVTYGAWPAAPLLVLVVVMLIGGGTGSASGGLKQHRIYLLCRAVAWEIRRGRLPTRAVVQHADWHGEQVHWVTDDDLRRLATFLFLYLATFAAGALVLAGHGYALRDALFEFASAQGNVGLSVGITSAAAPPLVLWAMTAGMFLGRLEFFVVLGSVAKLVHELPLLHAPGKGR